MKKNKVIDAITHLLPHIVEQVQVAITITDLDGHILAFAEKIP